MKKRNLMVVEFLVRGTIFVLLMFLVLFLFGCSAEQDTMLTFEIDDSEQSAPVWKTYTIEDDSTDLFSEWQDWQKNELSQREWDAYMKNE